MPEELVVRHCSPTLAGLKTGSMFNCGFASRDELHQTVRQMNQCLGKKGLRVLPLRWSDGNALIYIYRPDLLARDLGKAQAAELLQKMGYPCGMPERCIVTLICRLRQSSQFPHEVGLFLGYPPEDVIGFIENHARDCKCVGNWKVYGDERKARQSFARFRQCTNVYYARWQNGTPIEGLAVTVG